MDEFLLTIDKIKFRNTNAAWNELCLNDPWSVGYVSTLVEVHPFNIKKNGKIFTIKAAKRGNR